jgi:murein DD-endopeptidase MepM/ murein hydrolase activator NlpD
MHPLQFLSVLACLAGAVQARACDRGDSENVAYQHPSPAKIGNGFGPTVHPILGITRMHTGVDYLAPAGDPVAAAQAGTVVMARVDAGYGLRVVIRHGGGIETAYAHLAKTKVAPGDCVAKGDVIGTVGTSGLSASTLEPRLHFEILSNGRYLDPLSVLAARS